MFGQSYPTVRSFGNVTPWKEGDRITVAGVELEVLETPVAIYQESSDLIGNNVPLKFHI